MSLEEVRERIAAAARRAGRDPALVTLIAIGKSQPIEAISRVYDLGHRDFGENRAQELVDKAERLPRDIRWHFVGRLQTNKARLVRPLVVMLHSLDRLGLAEAWLKGPGLPPPVLLQVNVGREPQKGGARPEETARLIEEIESLGMRPRGLMTIPPLGDDPRPYFSELAKLRERLAEHHPDLAHLSMGMSDDYDVAIEEGSTMVRVGRAIFGPRPRDR